MLRDHMTKRTQMDSMINSSHNQGEEIVVRVRQQVGNPVVFQCGYVHVAMFGCNSKAATIMVNR